jgi:hypothetical protein
MLRVAGVNQEDRYQSGGSQSALIWPAVKYVASLTNKHRTARLPTMSLLLKAPAGPLRHSNLIPVRLYRIDRSSNTHNSFILK